MANILLQWLVTGMLFAMHPFYVSVLDINHNEKDAAVEISIRVFTDDMERVLQKYTTRKIDLTTPPDRRFVESQVSSYINQKLQLTLNESPVTPKFLGYEIQKESVWMYLEVAGTKEVRSLDIDCKLLYDLEPSQTNLVNAKANGKQQTYKLDNPKSKVGFQF